MDTFEKKHPMVRVEWEDSANVSRWHGLAEFQKEVPLLCVSVGYVIRDDEVALSVASSYDGQPNDAGNVNDATIIPRSAVRKVERLRVSKRGKK